MRERVTNRCLALVLLLAVAGGELLELGAHRHPWFETSVVAHEHLDAVDGEALSGGERNDGDGALSGAVSVRHDACPACLASAMHRQLPPRSGAAVRLPCPGWRPWGGDAVCALLRAAYRPLGRAPPALG